MGQADFLNAAVVVETELEPEQLLAACKAIERELGRVPGPRHSPRPIDLDLLMIQGREHDSDLLKVPHPAILHRLFVIEPLLELDPPNAESLRDQRSAINDQRVRRCSSRLT